MKLLLPIATMTALATAGTSRASTQIVVRGGLPTIIVHYSDLDIRSAAGRDILSQRVQAAASYLCFDPVVEPAGSALERHECYRAAIAGGRSQIRLLATATDTGGY